jgi:hypothetical protein
MPFGATPSRWCVYQFHHLGDSSTLTRVSAANALRASGWTTLLWRWRCGRRRRRSRRSPSRWLRCRAGCDRRPHALERQRQRGEEEESCADSRHPAEECHRAAAAKSAGRCASAQGSTHPGILPRLEEDDENHENAEENVDDSQKGQHRGAQPTEMRAALTTPHPRTHILEGPGCMRLRPQRRWRRSSPRLNLPRPPARRRHRAVQAAPSR